MLDARYYSTGIRISRRCLSARSLLFVSKYFGRSSCLNRAQPMLLEDATLKLRVPLSLTARRCARS